MYELDSRRLVVIVGAPRSGTTMLGTALAQHPAVMSLYEPYFIWEWYSGPASDDVRTATDADETTARHVRREFERARRKERSELVVVKTPRDSLKIPFIHAIFPYARWIHIVRDGRDATLSIHKQWRKRLAHGRSGSRLRYAAFALSYLRNNYPFVRHRLQMVLHELRQARSLNPLQYLHQSRWDGRVGWGPRFAGWQYAIDRHSLLEFNALQWKGVLRAVDDAWPSLPPARRMTLYYESLVHTPEARWGELLSFLDLGLRQAVAPETDPGRIGRWRQELDPAAIAEIEAIIHDMLSRFGYAPTCHLDGENVDIPLQDRGPER